MAAKMGLLDRIVEAAVEVARERPDGHDDDLFVLALVTACTRHMLANGEDADYWWRRVRGVIRGARCAELEFRRRRFIGEVARGVPQGQ